MTVRDLIEALEELPSDLPVVENECEITDILTREEVYFSADHEYKEGLIVKIY
jgi:hypothetical protein